MFRGSNLHPFSFRTSPHPTADKRKIRGQPVERLSMINSEALVFLDMLLVGRHIVVLCWGSRVCTALPHAGTEF